MFLIWNLTQQKWVAPAGSLRSYTTRLELARVFKSRAAAQSEVCGDERVVPMSDVAGG